MARPEAPSLPVAPAAGFAAVSAVHLVAQAVGQEQLADVTKTLLVPALAVVLLVGLGRAGRPAWAPLALLALLFSWLGDVALLGSGGWFLVGVGLFGVAQVAYALTFRRAGDASRTAGRPALAAPYVVWWAGLLLFFLVDRGADLFVAAVAGYGVALASMAWLDHRVGRGAATGAALFVLSDSLIGLGGAGLELPAHGFWVMLTYLAAQWLIVRGLLLAAGRDVSRPIPSGRPRTAPRT
ncbi:lysoplasmalogenase [Nocardioides solisilvae]|uniref:lysoplasmalogenase n=1 Tax=Nocardioides solisilvae TaxID=1542435 RepID=UPI000D743217|nr:lysoplasmalogenase [Nocardioides solisilvae]